MRLAIGMCTARSDEWFVAAQLRFAPGDTAAAQARIKALLDRRAAPSQPISRVVVRCSAIRRRSRGAFIEACGTQRCLHRQACVSEKHANFIVNTGAARAADIEALIAQVCETVERVQSVRLETEVRIVE